MIRSVDGGLVSLWFLGRMVCWMSLVVRWCDLASEGEGQEEGWAIEAGAYACIAVVRRIDSRSHFVCVFSLPRALLLLLSFSFSCRQARSVRSPERRSYVVILSIPLSDMCSIATLLSVWRSAESTQRFLMSPDVVGALRCIRSCEMILSL